MDFLNFLSGNGIFLLLALVLIVVFLYNKIKNRKR